MNPFFMKQIYFSLLFIFSAFAWSQNGSITGTVVDDSNATPLTGVNVVIKSLKLGAVTDFDGKFFLKNVPAGTYEVEFSFMGYKTKQVSEVIVVAKEPTELNTTLEEAKNQLEEVVITRTRAKAESVKSLLTMQKNNISVSDGISAETIKKTPDRTTSDVLRRISGASVQDNRFVIVRGLNDRYNVALLNGAPLPSSEPDRKAFSFDIFPSNILDNLIITKTASPDLPGEFAGGVIQINTKAVPDKNFQMISIGTGFNTITTFKEQRTYEGSGTDWIGFDNGVRDLPSTIPTTEVFGTLSFQEKAAIAKTFEFDWTINDDKFRPNTNFQYSIGRNIKFNERVLGILFSLSNTKTNTFNTTENFDYENPNDAPPITLGRIDDNNYIEQVLTAGLANFSFKFNPNHSISLKNVYSINSSDLVQESERTVVDAPRLIKSDVRWFTSNIIYSGQLNVENYFPTPKIKVAWNAFYSDIQRSIPNLRNNSYVISDPNSSNPNDNIPTAIILGNTGGPDYAGGMFFSENDESIKGGKIDVSKKFNLGKDFINEFKTGAFLQARERSFFARQLNYNQLNSGGTFDQTLLNQPAETIFSLPNMGVISPGVNGFTIGDYTKFTDAYTASADLRAAYIMLDNRYKKFRLVWGVRLEDFLQKLDSRLTEDTFLELNERQNEFLPSANLIFSINKKQNLRLSYSETLNRPEFRELAPFGFYDFTTQFFTQGNPDLKTATIKNIDIRYELYPGKGQILSFSYFNKKFDNPIEIQQVINNRTVIYQNAASAKNSGIEFEFRTLLSSIFTKNTPKVLEDITLFSNVSIIKSVVDVSNLNSAEIETSRPLQGQSPYVFNGGIQYLNADSGWSFSANINRAGNRIRFTEAQGKPAIWEKGRTFLDAQVSKSLMKKKMELKLNISNILAQDLILYQNFYADTTQYGTIETLANQIFTGDYHYEDGYSERDDAVISRTTFGRTFSFSITYNF